MGFKSYTILIKMTTPTNEITTSIKEGLMSFKDGIIGFINDMIPPNYKVESVFFISFIIAVIVTRWQEPKRKYLYGAVVTLLIFGTLRWIGIGIN